MRIAERSAARRVLRAAALGGLMLAGQIAAGPLASAQTASSKTITYNIPAGNLSSALTQWAQASGMKFLAASGVLQGRTTAGLSGTYEPHQALDALLANSGLTHSTNGSTVTISAPGNNAGATIDGAIALDTIDVSGGVAAEGFNADTPYETPGSTSYISAEQIQRLPGKSAGDIFKGTPGVISGSNRNGAAIDPNIRGMQGVNRVATTIDGAEQSTSNYRGYYGAGSRSYIDPDLMSGVTITKGPDGGAPGAIGGTVAMETLNAGDILNPGDTYGVRVKGTLSDNSITPEDGSKVPRSEGEDSLFGGKSGSIAFASTGENVDIVAAYVQRKSGNYFAGTQGDLTAPNYTGLEQALSSYKYGDEVFNTSQDVTSALLKSTIRPADGHELKLSYMHYANTFGEVTPLTINAGATPLQFPLSWIELDQASARYRWRPEDNKLIDFHVNAALSNTNENQVYTISSDYIPIAVRSQNYSFDAYNISRFDLGNMPFSLTYGGALKYEDAAPAADVDDAAGAYPVDGTRQIATLYAKGKWELLSWFTLDAGIEYLTFNTDYRGTPAYNYAGPEYTGYKGDGFSPSFGVTVTPMDGWQLFAKYSTGIRPMSLRETSWTRFDQVFNPDLKAEEARNWEFGTNILKSDVLLDNDKARLKLAYFDNVTDDFVGRAWIGDGLTSFNYDYVKFRGVELSGGYDNGWAFTDVALNYYLDWKACLTDGSCIDYTTPYDYLNNQIPPEFSASVTAGARLLDERLTAGGRLTYVGERLAQMNTSSSLAKNWAPYMVVDLFAQWKINERMTFDVSAENLLDHYYVDALNNTDIPAPGRTISVSFTSKLGGADAAADFPFFGPSQAASIPGADWTGLYFGVHAGYGDGSIVGETTAADGTPGGIPATESADQRLTGFLGGVQAGYNYQLSNRIVLGVESDISWSKLSDYSEAEATEAADLSSRNQLQARTDYRVNWLATLRGRLGYAFDRFQFYGTGGLAFLKETEKRTQYRSSSWSTSYPSGTDTDAFFEESDSAIRQGWTIGGGMEYAIGGGWSLKGEYLYAGFGAESFLFPKARSGVGMGHTVSTRCGTRNPSWPPCPSGASIGTISEYLPGTSDTVNGRKASNDVDLHTVKMGLNYRF